MRVEHYEKGMHYSDRELLLLARRVGRLATYCKRLKDESSVIRIETEHRATKKAQDSIKVMITIELPGKVLRAESRKQNALEAIERCTEKLEPQVKKYKEKHTAKGRSRSRRRAA